MVLRTSIAAAVLAAASVVAPHASAQGTWEQKVERAQRDMEAFCAREPAECERLLRLQERERQIMAERQRRARQWQVALPGGRQCVPLPEWAPGGEHA